MRRLFVLSFLALAVFTAAPAFADSTTVLDEFWGGNSDGSGYQGDSFPVYPPTPTYAIESAVLTYTGDLLTIDIVAVDHDDGYFNRFATGNETTYNLGDLFLSTNGWSPFGAAPYAKDDFSNGEEWEYVLDLGAPAFGAMSGGLDVYSYGGDPKLELGDLKWSEYRYTPAGQSAIAGLVGSWEILDTDSDGIYETLRYVLGASDGYSIFSPTTIDLQTYGLGIHWTMECANDIIEGYGQVVPEPATLALVAAGLLGGLARRRRRLA